MKYFKIIILFVCLYQTIGIGSLALADGASDKKDNPLTEEEYQLLASNLKPFTPTLLWEKSFGGQICEVDLAEESGDVMLGTTDKTMIGKKTSNIKISLLNNNGKVMWSQGPMEEIHIPINPHISDNGERITYDMIDFDTYFTVVFYVDKNNKEIWHKAIPGRSHISPDGSWVVVGPSGGTGKAIVILDEKGETVLKKEYGWGGSAYVKFSENSEYAGVMESTTYYNKNIYWVFDRKGNLILELKKEYGDGFRAFTENGLIALQIVTTSESIINLKKEIIAMGHRAIISGNGKLCVTTKQNDSFVELNIISLQEQKKHKSLKIPPEFYQPLAISYKGRYVVFGKNNIFQIREAIVLDLKEDKFWSPLLIIPRKEIIRNYSSNCQGSSGIRFTKDEKYMAVHVIGEEAVHVLKYFKIQ